MYNEYRSPSSPKNKLRFGTGITCCFRSDGHEVLDQEAGKQRTPRSPYAWLKSTAHDLPEIGDKCRNVIARRIVKTRRHHHQQEADFRYDPMSYALNFEDDSRCDEFPLRSFSMRLPASPSPQPQSMVVPPREVVV